MRRILFLISAVCCLFFNSCETEEKEIADKFENLEYDYSGIDLSSSDRGFVMTGAISAEGGGFQIIPHKKHETKAFVRYIDFNKERQNVKYDFSGEPPYLKDASSIKGEWGEINYDFNRSPYAINIEVNKNSSGKPRDIHFFIGEALCYVEIRLVQAAE